MRNIHIHYIYIKEDKPGVHRKRLMGIGFKGGALSIYLASLEIESIRKRERRRKERARVGERYGKAKRASGQHSINNL